MNTQREQLIQQWLTTLFETDQFKISFLAGDASFRRYARIKLNDKAFMLMDAPPDKEDCLPFVKIDEFFDQQGLRVPHIHGKDLSQGLLLLEDFGDNLLSSYLEQHTVDAYYQQCFKQLHQLQAIDASAADLPLYDYAMLMREMQLLSDWLLPALQIEPTVAEQQMIAQSYDFVADQVLQQPQVIVHRDFHSRNLMILADETDLGIIDFQDAVIGADSYDLISLTRDAYVQWPAAQVEQWFADFYALLPATSKQQRDLQHFKRDADVMSIQRHIKILGIFVRLAVRDGKRNYLNDMPRVMWYLQQELKTFPELAAFAGYIDEVVLPKFVTEFGDYQEVTA
ncbi:aminoglycoside phosphotransferase family protein [Acinetobacter larvae]|uniref:Phosphotransferase n=1 Tax=Acinetobacter larvae TaxID=1789224 RepID=A0A1B2LYD6_9GAMM|nr:phosphotransferase [Acinetobacter larvae]AOA57951.1 phosphotransferase [Acinetobacter larvae]